jgi:hypothetical protein
MFQFKTDSNSFEFCCSIIREMVTHFEIDEDEAIKRINNQWEKSDFIDEEDIRYHETEKDWAYTIYYGPDSHWWKRSGDPTLKPLPIE